MLLSELMVEQNLSKEDVLARLNENGVTIRRGDRKGQPVSLDDVERRGDRIPPAWADALGVEASAASPGRASRGEEAGGATGGRRSERPPVAPPGTVPVILEAGARKRISGAYKFAGAALAAGSGSEGVAVVWSDSSDKIADLWLAAAQENPWAARFVNMMSAGGPAGDLAAGHLYLAGATLYVLGAAIPGGDSIFPKYSRYRPVVTVDHAAEPEPGGASENGDGAANVAAETRLG